MSPSFEVGALYGLVSFTSSGSATYCAALGAFSSPFSPDTFPSTPFSSSGCAITVVANTFAEEAVSVLHAGPLNCVSGKRGVLCPGGEGRQGS